MDSLPYLKAMPKAFAQMRKIFGDKIELLHDVHERVEPIEVVNLLKQLEEYRPFFIEDPLHRNKTATSKCCANTRLAPSRWANCSTILTNGSG